MSTKRLHIVSFDVPFPPNYGGVIDVYCKIRALHAQGFEVTLHCFDYGRGVQKDLMEICAEVHYYKRRSLPSLLLNKAPFVVISRKNKTLLNRLTQDNAPILFEGLHTTGFIDHPALANRKKFVRTHNIEHDYYAGLAKVEKNTLKRIYFKSEARKLKHYEAKLKHASGILAISPNDKAYLESHYDHVFYLPVFHLNEDLDINLNAEPFALYHGNLGVGENNEAALFLIQEVFTDPKVPLVIAGTNPSEPLKQACAQVPHITLLQDVDNTEIIRLIRSAQLNVLPTFQPTGIKLKLLTALFNGKHCLVNTPMVENTGLASLCHVADAASDMKSRAHALFQTPFTAEDVKQRSVGVSKQFRNATNIEVLVKLLQEDGQ